MPILVLTTRDFFTRLIEPIFIFIFSMLEKTIYKNKYLLKYKRKLQGLSKMSSGFILKELAYFCQLKENKSQFLCAPFHWFKLRYLWRQQVGTVPSFEIGVKMQGN